MAGKKGIPGRNYALYFVIGDPDKKPADADYKPLGMMRGKAFGVSWDTADATGDKSPDYLKESLVTYKEFTISGDGVTRGDDVHNQSAFSQHVISPGEVTDNQPMVWFKLTSPIKTVEGLFLVTSWEEQGPHDDVATWSFEATSAGEVAVKLATKK